VVGIPDERKGEAVTAIVSSAKGLSPIRTSGCRDNRPDCEPGLRTHAPREKPAHIGVLTRDFTVLLCPAHNNAPRSARARCPRNCRRINESTRPLTGLGSGVSNESRFLGKCVGCGHVDHGYLCSAVGDQDRLRQLNRQDAGVEQEASGQEEVRDQGIPSAAAEACHSSGFGSDRGALRHAHRFSITRLCTARPK
jgi:hypothetical protein